MTTTLTGSSDDIIEFDGELFDELYPNYSERKGVIGLSDGTLLGFEYDKDGIWRFKPIVKGALFVRVDQGSVDDDTFDVVHFKGGLKWAVLGEAGKFCKA